MKVVLLHGDNTAKSRARYAQIITGIKKRGWETYHLSLDDKFSFKEKLVSNSIFQEEYLFILDKTQKLPVEELSWLKKHSDNIQGQLLLYSDKALPATTLKNLPPSVKIEKYDFPKTLFNFLDNLVPGRSDIALKQFKELVEQENFEFILAMIGRHFRDLLWIQSGSTGMKYPSWRKDKLLKTANKYTKQELVGIIQSLAEIDIRSKTSDVNAILLIELLILEKLS